MASGHKLAQHLEKQAAVRLARWSPESRSIRSRKYTNRAIGSGGRGRALNRNLLGECPNDVKDNGHLLGPSFFG